MAKDILFAANARAALVAGINKVNDAVKTTLGPMGRVVVIGQQYGSPVTTKDGVTVAKSIELEDNMEDLGAQLCKEVASKTNDEAGDGTTTATVLASAMVTRGMKVVAAGGNPVSVKRGLDEAVRHAVDFIKEYKREVSESNDILRIATIAGNDEEVGQKVSQAIDEVGKDGVVTLEESSTNETVLEIVDGFTFDSGYVSKVFVSNPETMECVFERPYILVSDGRIDSLNEILPVLEEYAKAGDAGSRGLLVLAEDFSADVVHNFVLNRLRGVLPNTCLVKGPGFGKNRADSLADIAVATGAKLISKELGVQGTGLKLSDLGECHRSLVSNSSTVLVQGMGSSDSIKDRIAQIKATYEQSQSKYDQERCSERVSRLTGGVAVIKVGASTDSEVKEKKHRYEDAIQATKAALEEGIVPGGGTTYAKAVQYVKANSRAKNQDEQAGINLVLDSLLEPVRQIAFNAGYSGDVVVDKVLSTDFVSHGHDASTGQIVDMFAAGIIDPAKVTRNALQNSASIAGLALITECIVNDRPKPDNMSGMPGMGM